MAEEPRRDERSRDRRSNLALPVLLIAAGVLLLLSQFGLFDWGVLLGILDLWPLLLIALGADILTRGRYRLPIVLAVVVLGAVFYRAPTGWTGWGGPAEVHDVAYDLDAARSARIELDHGVGVLNVDALPQGSDLLAGGRIGTGERERLVRSFSVENGVAVLRLSGEQRGPSFSVRGNDRRWDLALSRSVPIELNVDTGVGESNLRLRELTLGSFDLDAGVGEVRVTLPERGGYRGEIDAGVGEVTVRVPRSVEARVTISTGLGGADVNGEWVRDGDVHTTPGYERADAQDRVDLRISGGVGRIQVVRID